MRNHHVQDVVLVLAAGEGRRYGSTKQLKEIEGEPMIRRVLLNIIAPDSYHVAIVLGAFADNIRPVIEDIGVEIVNNVEWMSGISSSIRAGVSFVHEHFPDAHGLMIVLGDQWMISRDHLKVLMTNSRADPESIIATNYGGEPGVPVYFPKNEWPMLLSLQGDEGAKQILQSRSDILLVNLPEATVDLDFPEES